MLMKQGVNNLSQVLSCSFFPTFLSSSNIFSVRRCEIVLMWLPFGQKVFEYHSVLSFSLSLLFMLSSSLGSSRNLTGKMTQSKREAAHRNYTTHLSVFSMHAMVWLRWKHGMIRKGLLERMLVHRILSRWWWPRSDSVILGKLLYFPVPQFLQPWIVIGGALFTGYL